MPSTLEQAVKVDGVDLHTLGYGLATVSGRLGMGSRAGSVVTTPYRGGRRIVAHRSWAPRTETWMMWVQATDPDTGAYGGIAQVNENVDALLRLFSGSPLTLTKTRRMDSGLVTVTADAEATGVRAEPTGPLRRMLTVDLLFGRPHWYGALVSSTSGAGASSFVVNGAGHVEAHRVVVRFTAVGSTWTNPTLTNDNYDPALMLGYTGAISAGNYVEVDADLATARTQTGSSVIGSITHSGDPLLMKVRPGSQTFLVGGSTRGTVSVSYRPAYHN